MELIWKELPGERIIYTGVSQGTVEGGIPLPEGRSRMYLENIDPNSIARTISQVTVDDPEVRVVFLSETADTRYDEYSVLRSLEVAEEVEARKGN